LTDGDCAAVQVAKTGHGDSTAGEQDAKQQPTDLPCVGTWGVVGGDEFV
jgi:hypothetical protein